MGKMVPKMWWVRGGLLASISCGLIIIFLATFGGGKAVSQGVAGTRGEDIDLLARVIDAEARGEPYIGQVAVGAVILKRIRHAEFPNTLSGVIYHPHAFESVTNERVWHGRTKEEAHQADAVVRKG